MFDWLGVARDLLVIGYMLFVRIGVPVLLTWMLGKWLQKTLQEHDQRSVESIATAHESPSCELGHQATNNSQLAVPCWLALQVSGHGLKPECYTCPLYTTTGRHLQSVPVAVRRSSKH